ncbi:MAG: DoxX family protein [Candidatus Peribacteraceae bacterium]|nr:DoxX family protein [Candidatus Peribacteraceae bacterium]
MTALPLPSAIKDACYTAFRVLIGFLFLWHGAQKVGLMDREAAEGFMFFIGCAELIGGLAIMAGFLTAWAALGGLIIMVGAYVQHASGADAGLLPIENRGELALVYLASFLCLIALGSGRWSIDRCCLAKRK